jgi:hypothetical protein
MEARAERSLVVVAVAHKLLEGRKGLPVLAVMELLEHSVKEAMVILMAVLGVAGATMEVGDPVLETVGTVQVLVVVQAFLILFMALQPPLCAPVVGMVVSPLNMCRLLAHLFQNHRPLQIVRPLVFRQQHQLHHLQLYPP